MKTKKSLDQVCKEFAEAESNPVPPRTLPARTPPEKAQTKCTECAWSLWSSAGVGVPPCPGFCSKPGNGRGQIDDDCGCIDGEACPHPCDGKNCPKLRPENHPRPLPARTPLEKAQAKRDRRAARLRDTHSAIEAAGRQADPATARRTDIRRRTYDPATISDPAVPAPAAGRPSGGPGAKPPAVPPGDTCARLSDIENGIIVKRNG